MKRVLVANRGEIAVRIILACQKRGLETVVCVSDADRKSMAAAMADKAICIGPASASKSYLDIEAVVTAAVGTGCDALHPGYGFLAENAQLAALCDDHNITFIGPRPETINNLGDKINARRIAEQTGVPVVPGRNHISTYADALQATREIGFPALLKAAAGGGGRGMQVVASEAELRRAFDTASAEARACFGNETLYLERFIRDARHVEVQILGDGSGKAIHLGERDCTLQRRHQKIVEEAPANDVPADVIAQMCDCSVNLAKSVGYLGAGTVEFIFDRGAQQFYFLEVNTRVQVEHPVTEELTGVDIVSWQLQIASGEPVGIEQDQIRLDGHVIECRINAESAADGFRPSPGEIRLWQQPSGPHIRVDTHCSSGYSMPPYYDSLLAKLIVKGRDREDALEKTREALAAFRVEGIETTLPFLRALFDRPEVSKSEISTVWIEQLLQKPDFLEQLQGRDQ